MNSQTICIIEDSKPIRRLFCTILEKSGFSTVDFEDAKTSIEWIKNNQADLIILDILLPDMNGTELLNQIRKVEGYASVPVIAITGFATANDKDKYLAQGFDAYMPKPVNTATFVQDVKAMLNSTK